jgi:hypothetical protein
MHLAAKGGVCVVGKTNKLRLHRRYIAAKSKVWSIRYVLLAATFLHRPAGRITWNTVLVTAENGGD